MNKTETKSEHSGETSPVSLFTEWMQQALKAFSPRKGFYWIW